MSVLGVTGAPRDPAPRSCQRWSAAVRQVTDLPIGVGFGVQTPEQAAWVAGFADAVIVGSALARVIEESAPADAPARVGEFVASLAACHACRRTA